MPPPSHPSRPEEAIVYASAGQLVREAFDAFLPPRRITVAEWAAANRWLANAGGGYVGRWSHDEAPYTVEPMECLTGTEFLTVAVVGPGQSAKTEIAHNWLLHSIDTDPADFLWYMQTDPGVEAHVKGRVQPMIDAHDAIKARLGPRPSDDTLHYKAFAGMAVQFLSATHSNLINKSAPRIVADEVDAYAAGLGDVKALLDVRRQTFGRASKLLMLSHPDLATGPDPARDWTAGIMASYADSDRRTWWWPCPQCGGYSSPNPGAARRMVLDYPEDAPLDEVEQAARLLCPLCGALIEDGQRRAMNLAGRWVALGEEIDEDGRIGGRRARRDTAGFWIVGVMSPFILGGIGALARAREKARREAEASGDDSTLRQVVVKQEGVPYQPPRRVGSVDAQALAERAEPRLALGAVPEGVRVLTTAADVQGNRFELLVRGWGPGMESWVVDRQAIPAEPATSAADWDALMRRLATLAYPLADGSGRVMRVRCAVFDSAGQAGVTEQAYAAWLRARRAGLARRAGRIEGRDAWQLCPAKGASSAAAPRITVAYPDSARKDRKAGARGQVPVLLFNPDLAKDALAAQLQVAEAGAPGAVHFPAALLSPGGPPHDFFEQLAAERRNARGRWEKAGAHLRNEAIDLMVMAEVAARLHGLHRIDWDRPPAWAAPWDRNSMVGAPETAGGEAAAPAQRAPVPPPAAAWPAAAAASSAPPAVLPRAPRVVVASAAAARRPGRPIAALLA